MKMSLGGFTQNAKTVDYTLKKEEIHSTQNVLCAMFQASPRFLSPCPFEAVIGNSFFFFNFQEFALHFYIYQSNRELNFHQ